MSSVNSKQIAKNTIFLYIRMLLLLAVSLYTSRVILKVLGIDDYGIYNLIAGFVMFLAFISNALVSAMQRYFNVALGKKDFQNYKDVFSIYYLYNHEKMIFFPCFLTDVINLISL